MRRKLTAASVRGGSRVGATGPNKLPAHVLEQHHNTTPNYSMRMTNLTAAILRPQLATMEARVARFDSHYDILVSCLQADPRFSLPSEQQQLAKEQRVATSLQFELTAFSDTQMERYVSLCADHGVPLAWFGRKVPVGFTSSINQW